MPGSTIPIRLGRLKAEIRGSKKYEHSKSVWCERGPLKNVTAKKALTIGRLQRAAAQAVARDFGRPVNYFIKRSSKVDAEVQHASNIIRSLLIKRIITGDLQVEQVRDGRVFPTNLFEEGMALKDHARVASYKVTKTVVRQACEDLDLQNWGYWVSEDVYHVQPLIEIDLEPIIRHRVEVEMIQVREIIAKGKRDRDFRDRFRRDLRDAYDVCVAHQIDGRGFRESDHKFHALMANGTREIAESIIQMVEAADQVYMRWRQLLAITLGKGSKAYADKIMVFNEGQCVELEGIVLEFERPEWARQGEIRDLLDLHSRRQFNLLAECRQMLEKIRVEGDTNVAKEFDEVTA